MRSHQSNIPGRGNSALLSELKHTIAPRVGGLLELTNSLLPYDFEESELDPMRAAGASGSTLVELLSSALDVSQIENGSIRFACAPVDLRNIAKTTRIQLEAPQARRRVRVDLAFDERIPRRLFGDAARIGRVLLTLTAQTARVSKRGTVSLSFTRGRARGEDSLELYISIDAAGAVKPMGVKHNLIKPAAPAAATRDYGAAGCDASMMIKIVGAMGGSFSMANDAGYHFTIPLRLAPAQSAQASPARR
ncbi:MAG: hypothetical protein HY286_13140 [Planctomycetes bacterium]|nr:hypothetical protein [Planctomycetota bacterium]